MPYPIVSSGTWSVCISIIVMKGVAGDDVPIGTIYRGALPFFLTDIFNVALLVTVPQIVLFLPGLMM